MKKFINRPESVEREMTEGLVKAYPQKLEKLPEGNIVVRKHRKKGKVALVSPERLPGQPGKPTVAFFAGCSISYLYPVYGG